MKLTELEEKINYKLDKNLINSRLLLDNMRVIDENSRKTSAYNDNRYIPFYYYLGQFISPINMLEIGMNLGLLSACFLKSCKSVEKYVGFQEANEGYYSSRMAIANIKSKFKGEIRYLVGDILDLQASSIDLALIDYEGSYDKHLAYIDYAWEACNTDGLIVINYVKTGAKQVYESFCKIKNREGIVINTRYGTGIIQK